MNNIEITFEGSVYNVNMVKAIENGTAVRKKNPIRLVDVQIGQLFMYKTDYLSRTSKAIYIKTSGETATRIAGTEDLHTDIGSINAACEFSSNPQVYILQDNKWVNEG